jgi:signal transduction histidine kinase
MRSRLHGVPLLIVLLIVTFAIAGELAIEAWGTARAERETARRALRDYTHFAASTMSEQARANLGTAFASLLDPATARRGTGEIPTRYRFRLDLSARERPIEVSGDTVPSAAELAWLRDTISTHARLVRRHEWNVAFILGPPIARRVVAYTVRSESGGEITHADGVVTDVESLGRSAFTGLARGRILATDSAGAGLAYDSLVTAAVLEPGGARLLEIDPPRPTLQMAMLPRPGHETYHADVVAAAPVTLFADTVSLGAQYGSLSLAVALASNAPARLVPRGVPPSRVLILLGLLVLMAGLVAVAVLQLRREHELARIRAEFTASVSHELRTPLAQILLYGETLILERTRSDRERRSAAEVIVREARRLMRLVENALHFARSDRRMQDLSPEPIVLAPLTRDVLTTFAPLAWAAHVTLSEVLDPGASVVMDREAFRQILLNLLDNAVKYGPPGQTVSVRLSRDGDRVLLWVEDAGPGVPVADRDRIWRPFVRGAPATPGPRVQTGTGIGLAVVRDLVDRHRGRAWVEDAPGGGARFVVQFPETPAISPDSDNRPGESAIESGGRPSSFDARQQRA